MKKGKRYKAKRYKRKGRRRLSIFKIIRFIFIISLIIILGSKIKSKIVKQSVDADSHNEISSNVMSNASNDDKVEAAEAVEDDEIKKIIEETLSKNDLNEDNFSFYYYNVDLNKKFFYNEDHYFTAASSIKLPIAMSYYDKINRGELSVDDKLQFTKDSYEAGMGSTASIYSSGDYVPIKFLIEQSIVNSDNTATNILINNLSYKEYRKEISTYSSIVLPEKFFSDNIMSAKYSYDVVNHLYKNMQNYTELMEFLKKSSNGEYLKKYIKDYDVAHKYGSYDGYVNDHGIVFGKTTYLIGIFTKNVKDADEFIAKLSLAVFEKVNK